MDQVDMQAKMTWNSGISMKVCLIGLNVLVVLALMVGGGLCNSAYATDLPAGVMNYLREKDPQVRVRFDGLVIFSNGESYIPVIPQDPALNAEPQMVIQTWPESSGYPDLIQFDNHYFLMRLIQTASGRITFPRMGEYPIQLKEGLLPQDFVMPNNLFIPAELKIILGSLPYHPDFEPQTTPTLVPVGEMLKNVRSNHPEHAVTQRRAYVYDLGLQKLRSIELATGYHNADVPLSCIPSGLRLSPDGKLLLVPCLSTNELVVIDTSSNLVKTRIPVGQRPDAVLLLPNREELLISNRHSPFLSVANSTELLPGSKIELPGNGGAMTLATPTISHVRRVVVADAFKPLVYLVDLDNRQTLKTIATLPDISAMQVVGNELWVASRTKNQVQVVHLDSGYVQRTFDVGQKPVAMALFGNRLFVLSAGDDQLDVIEWPTRTMHAPIRLPASSFPTSMAMAPSEKKAYITTAGANNLIVVNLEKAAVESTLMVDYRGSLIAITPDPAEVQQFEEALQTYQAEQEAQRLAELEALQNKEPPSRWKFKFWRGEPEDGTQADQKAQTPASSDAEPSAVSESDAMEVSPDAEPSPAPARKAAKKAKPTQEVLPEHEQPAFTPVPTRPLLNPALNSEVMPTQRHGGRGVTFRLGKSKKKPSAEEEDGAGILPEQAEFAPAGAVVRPSVPALQEGQPLPTEEVLSPVDEPAPATGDSPVSEPTLPMMMD